MNTTYCQYNETQVRESGLLTAERMAEVSREIDARISPCFDRDGREIPQAKLADCGRHKGRLLFARFDYATAEEYMRREIMSGVLTDDELKLINDQCTGAYQAAKDAERFAKAEKLDSWDGGAFWGDEYFSDMDELCDRIVGDGDEWPEYVWAAYPKRVVSGLDAAEVTQNCIENNGWEDMTHHDLNGVEALEAALNAFEKANESVLSYEPDYSKAILMAAWKSAEQGAH